MTGIEESSIFPEEVKGDTEMEDLTHKDDQMDDEDDWGNNGGENEYVMDI